MSKEREALCAKMPNRVVKCIVLLQHGGLAVVIVMEIKITRLPIIIPLCILLTGLCYEHYWQDHRSQVQAKGVCLVLSDASVGSGSIIPGFT